MTLEICIQPVKHAGVKCKARRANELEQKYLNTQMRAQPANTLDLMGIQLYRKHCERNALAGTYVINQQNLRINAKKNIDEGLHDRLHQQT